MSLTYELFWALTWGAALVTAAAHFAWSRNWKQALGMGLMSVPVWIAVWSFVDSIDVLRNPSSQPRARTKQQLLRSFWRGSLIDLGYLGTGFVLWIAGRHGWPASIKEIAGHIPSVARDKLTESRSALIGLLGFPALLLGSFLTDAGVRQAASLVNGDESLIFSNMSPAIALLISIRAGLTEELVYRAFLMIGATWVFAKFLPSRWALGAALVFQAVVFGLAHAGYGTWAHVLVPFLFGLFAGAVTLRFGLWAAIVLHVLIDVYAIGAYAIAGSEVWKAFLWLFLTFNVTLTTVWLSLQLHERLEKNAEREI